MPLGLTKGDVVPKVFGGTPTSTLRAIVALRANTAVALSVDAPRIVCRTGYADLAGRVRWSSSLRWRVR